MGRSTKKPQRDNSRAKTGKASSVELETLIELRRLNGKSQWAFHGDASIEVQTIKGKGKGIVALRDFQPGELVLAEPPLAAWNVIAIESGQADTAGLDATIAALDTNARREYFELVDVHGTQLSFSPSGKIQPAANVASEDGYEHKSAAGIWASNAFSTDASDCFTPSNDALTRCAVFKTIARINHSCRPSSYCAWNPTLGLQAVHALRSIERGEEITIAYLGGAAWDGTRTNRQLELERKYRFSCTCQACSLCGDALERSEARLRRMIATRESILASPPDLLERVEELCRLAEEEGQPIIWHRTAMLEAMMHAKQAGRAQEALGWAERGAESALLAMGAESPTTVKFEMVVTAFRNAMSRRPGAPLPG